MKRYLITIDFSRNKQKITSHHNLCSNYVKESRDCDEKYEKKNSQIEIIRDAKNKNNNK